MKYPPQSWPWSQPASLPHSTEVEHRLTVVETIQEERLKTNERRHSDITELFERHDRRLNLHEKAILGLGALLQVLMQDKYPALAALIKGLMP